MLLKHSSRYHGQEVHGEEIEAKSGPDDPDHPSRFHRRGFEEDDI